METHRLTPADLAEGKHLDLIQNAKGPLTLSLAPGEYRHPLVIEATSEGSDLPELHITAERPGEAVFTGADRFDDWQMAGANRWTLDFKPTAEQRLIQHFGVITLPIQVFIGEQRLELAKTIEALAPGRFAYDGERIWMQLDDATDPRLGDCQVSVREQMGYISRPNTHISGLKVTRAACSIQRHGFRVEADHVSVRHCEFSEAAGGVGASFRGSNLTIERNHIHHNGQMGFSFKATDSLFAENTVACNDLRNFNDDPDAEWNVWESGGGKVVYTRNSVFRANRFIDNRSGPGLWFDIDNFHNRIEGNYFSGNGHSSIMIEISWDNTVCNNIICDTRQCNYAAAAILVQLSSRTRIYHNTIYRSEGYGVHLRWHVRQRDIHPYTIDDPDEFEKAYGFRQEDWMPAEGDYPVKENEVYNNVFVDCLWGAIGYDRHPSLTQDNRSDHNLFYNSHSLHPMAGGHRLLEWQETTGLDPNSYYDKAMQYRPLFRDAANGDFRLAAPEALDYKVPTIEACPEDFTGAPRTGQSSTVGAFAQ